MNWYDQVIQKTARLSTDGQYRYYLSRSWNMLGSITYIMLNPSTADSEKDDATIRKCMGFAKTWGYGGIQVVNLFAHRSTDPKQLLGVVDPVGSNNNSEILAAVPTTGIVVAAWGCEHMIRHKQLMGRDIAVMALLAQQRPHVKVMCLGTTKNGTPRHPLMLGYATPLVEYKG